MYLSELLHGLGEVLCHCVLSSLTTFSEIQLIQAAILKFGWSVFIVVSIAYFIRSLLLYINFRERDDDHTQEERAYGIILCVFFSVCIIILTVFLQHTNYVSSRLGVKIQVNSNPKSRKNGFARPEFCVGNM
jgi:hypothetical protein